MDSYNIHCNDDTLRILDLIRRKLHFFGFPELSLDFPIIELGDEDTGEGHDDNRGALLKTVLGLTDCDYVWPSADVKGVKYSVSFTVKYLAIRLRGSDGLPMALERIIPTFIHELGHACVRGCLSKKTSGQRSRGHKPAGHLFEDSQSEWQLIPHNREFYEKYSRLLECAEVTGIFRAGSVLEGNNDRFSEKNLKKLDDLDLARAPLTVIGSTMMNDESFRSTLFHKSGKRRGFKNNNKKS